ncbi:hypothetical protein D3C80_1393860 [compost metagenome]
MLSYIRQLGAQKLQALCGFGGVTLDVLQYVEAVDLIEHLVGQIGIFVFQRQCDDAGLFATLSGRHIFLVLQNSVETTLFGDREQRTRIGVQGGNL